MAEEQDPKVVLEGKLRYLAHLRQKIVVAKRKKEELWAELEASPLGQLLRDTEKSIMLLADAAEEATQEIRGIAVDLWEPGQPKRVHTHVQIAETRSVEVTDVARLLTHCKESFKDALALDMTIIRKVAGTVDLPGVHVHIVAKAKIDQDLTPLLKREG